MTTIQPPAWLQGGPGQVDHPADLWRLASLAPFAAAGGVLADDDLEVTAGPALAVTVAAGEAVIPGTLRPYQGAYYAGNDGPVELTLAVPDATNPRRDLVVAVVRDGFESGVVDEWALEVVTGAAGATPSDPATPDNAVVLARVNVPADGTATWTPSAGDLDDLRTVARLRPSLLARDTAPTAPTDLATRDYVDTRPVPSIVGVGTNTTLDTAITSAAAGAVLATVTVNVVAGESYRIVGRERFYASDNTVRQARLWVDVDADLVASTVVYLIDAGTSEEALDVITTREVWTAPSTGSVTFRLKASRYSGATSLIARGGVALPGEVIVARLNVE